MSELKPDIERHLSHQMEEIGKDMSKEELEKRDKGFYCTECGHRELTLPIKDNYSIDLQMDNVCRKCKKIVNIPESPFYVSPLILKEDREGTLVNALSEQIDKLVDIQEMHDRSWLPLSTFRDEFPYNTDRFDHVVNYLLTRSEGINACIVIEDGENMLHIETDK